MHKAGGACTRAVRGVSGDILGCVEFIEKSNFPKKPG
jgi:hypothetical protein